MKGAINIGRLAGIKIYIHWTFSLLLIYVIYQGLSVGDSVTDIAYMLGLVFAIFGCVTLHELGHSLAARRYGIETYNIVLLPIGGVAQLVRMPEKPIQELIIAVAGPLVNVVIALFLGIIQVIFVNIDSIKQLISAEEANLGIETFLFSLLVVNIVLIIFNAIPAFPMDGGRVLRALLAMKLSRVKATTIAARIGQVIAILFGIYGFFYNPVLVFIAFFIFITAAREEKDVKLSGALNKYVVKDILRTSFNIFDANRLVEEMENEFRTGMNQDFLVKDEEKQEIAVLKRESLLEALKNETKTLPIGLLAESQQRIPFITLDMPLKRVYHTMLQNKFNLLPVWDEEQLVGVVDIGNINNLLAMQ